MQTLTATTKSDLARITRYLSANPSLTYRTRGNEDGTLTFEITRPVNFGFGHHTTAQTELVTAGVKVRRMGFSR